ncbi:MAG: Alpha/Beta hydrolase protein [Piptocephalis tieghemiana]|nr:MAG: Alpha/Beta hydrolase protein [Piptocephalis tieghemiana]
MATTAAGTSIASQPGASIASNKGFCHRISHFFHPTSAQEQEESERRLLSRLPFFSSSSSPSSDTNTSTTVARVGPVEIGQGQYINTLWIDQETGVIPSVPPNDTKSTLVMTHGYGAGLGHFYRNYLSLSSVPGWRIYSMDWLGMGRSSRPKFRIDGRTDEERVQQTEDFFVDSLEKWRAKLGIERMTLLGHSMGGYLSVAYALRFPERVEKLILVSPVGVPSSRKDPKALSGRVSLDPNPDSSITQDSPSPSPKYSPFIRGAAWLATKAWEASYTPMNLIRAAGPMGRSLLGPYINRRMECLSEVDKQAMWDYTYHIFAAQASSESALSHLLLPGAYARMPLAPRIPSLTMPTTFVYGESDWMDDTHASRLIPLMSVPANIVIIPGGGHNMFLEAPVAFDDCITKEMLKVSASKEKRESSSKTAPSS